MHGFSQLRMKKWKDQFEANFQARSQLPVVKKSVAVTALSDMDAFERRLGSTFTNVRVRLHIIRNACIENVGKSQSCMVSKLRIIWKQTV